MWRRRKAFTNTPTVDLYFRLPLSDLISEDAEPHDARPIRRVGDNCFIANRRGVIIRYASKAELRLMHAANLESCAYLVDDDFHALVQDTTLPSDYRRRLLRFRKHMLPEILKLCDTVIAPNEAISDRYREKRHRLLHPAPVHICNDFSHFSHGDDIHIVFSGTRSHLQDLQFIAPVIADILKRHPEIVFTTFLGKHAPGILRRLPNVKHHSPQPWGAYRHLLKTQRFHIAIAPFLNTAFNRARSINKVLDHAAFGAAGIYSAGFRPCDIVEHDEHGLCVANTHEDWRLALENLITNHPTRPKQLATQAARMLRNKNYSQKSRMSWKHFFDIRWIPPKTA